MFFRLFFNFLCFFCFTRKKNAKQKKTISWGIHFLSFKTANSQIRTKILYNPLTNLWQHFFEALEVSAKLSSIPELKQLSLVGEIIWSQSTFFCVISLPFVVVVVAVLVAVAVVVIVVVVVVVITASTFAKNCSFRIEIFTKVGGIIKRKTSH